MKQIWCNYNTLMAAFNSAKERKSYYHTVMNYESNLSENLEKLLEKLDNGSYLPKPYREFYIHDPKTRLIQAPTFEDRIVHHALIAAIRMPLDRKLIHDTYACRIGKGSKAASKRLTHFIRNNENVWALKIDIKKFFYTIDHDRVSFHLANIINCEDTLKLIQQFYRNDSGKGLPLGNATSQLLANLALNTIDQHIKREHKIKSYLRYMDDMVLLHEEKDYLLSCLKSIKQKLNEEKLEVNNRTGLKRITQGITFVGYKHYKTHTILKPKNIAKIRRVMKTAGRVDNVVSYLAFSKDTASLKLVSEITSKMVPDAIPAIKKFINKHCQRKAS